MEKSFFGVIGLGVMGSSLSLNIAAKGYSLAVYNRTVLGEEAVLPNFLKKVTPEMNVSGFTHLKDFVNALESPRKILLMIKAGTAIDTVLEQLIPVLSEGDIIIDAGNSHYLDTNKRCDYLQKHKLHFMGCGVSGGEEGARKGPSIMLGGNQKAYQIIAPILEAIAAKDNHNNPCCSYIGADGAGHFVKMVHNGIEYAEMQLLAEMYALLSVTHTNGEIATIFSEWNTTDLSSYLLEITIAILRFKEDEKHTLETILDKAGNKGTGSWSTKVAFDLGTVNTMMSSAVFSRYISSFKNSRVTLSEKIKSETSKVPMNIDHLEKAYRFARIINHHQCFELLRKTTEYNWNLNVSEIARIWTNGCIIRSAFMQESVAILKENENYLSSEKVIHTLIASEKSIKESIHNAMDNRIAFDTFWSAYNFWISITTKKLPANLIQAQRDYFGAHTYQKINDTTGTFFHTNWY